MVDKIRINVVTRFYTFREVCELLRADPKTIRKWMEWENPSISLQSDERDGRVKKLSRSDVQKLAKAHGISLGHPQEKSASNSGNSERIAELEERVEKLEAQLADLAELLRERKGSVKLPVPRPRPIGMPSDAEVPVDLQDALSLTQFAAKHHLNPETVRSGIRSGAVPSIEKKVLVGRNYHSIWLTPQSHAIAYEHWREHPDFLRCDQCPQE